MKAYLKRKWQAILAKERSPERLARSVALGWFMAFSPFLGIQSYLVFPIAPLCSANAAIAFTVLFIVSNPWTFIPIVLLNYFVGYYLTEHFFHLNLQAYNPSFMGWVNAKLMHYFPSLVQEGICFWCFIIGATIISFVTTAIVYPVLLKIFRRTLKPQETSVDLE